MDGFKEERIGYPVVSELTKSSDWKEYRIEELDNLPSEAAFGKVRLTVKPVDSTSLSGTIRFDRIYVDRIPRLELTITPTTRIIRTGEALRVEARLNGVPEKARRIRLRMVDCDEKEIGSWIRIIDTIDAKHETNQSMNVADTNPGILVSKQNENRIRQDDLGPPVLQVNPNRVSDPEAEGQVDMFRQPMEEKDSFVATWKIPIRESGFYRLHVDVMDAVIGKFTKSTSIIAVPSNNATALAGLLNMRIGWSLPGLDKSIKISHVPKLLEETRAGRVKFSVWLAASDRNNGESIGWMIESLNNKGVTSVGVIEVPTSAELREKISFRPRNENVDLARLSQDLAAHVCTSLEQSLALSNSVSSGLGL